jgi:prepilin-type processing-associated H-X9-DG protein
MPTAIKSGEDMQTWTGDNFSDAPGVGALQPWLKIDKLRCPSWLVTDMTADQHDSVQGYGYNVSAFPGQIRTNPRPLPLLSSIEKPAQMVVFADAAHILNYPGDVPSLMGSYAVSAPAAGRPLFHGRHNGWGNVVWADGHIKAMQPLYMTARRKPISLQQSFQVGYLDRDGKSTTNEFFDLNPGEE